MLEVLTTRLRFGKQYVPDVRTAAVAAPFRGLPCIVSGEATAWESARVACPAGALAEPGIVDLGRCVFCGDCASCGDAAASGDAAATGPVVFTAEHRLAATSRDALRVGADVDAAAYQARLVPAGRELRRLLGRSLRIRSVSAGGCAGCELELNATQNVNFDLQRYGIEITASPRHADALVLTGPVTANMAAGLEDTWAAMPEPKVLIAAGACAISGGVFAGSPALDRSFLETHPPDLFLPGCPVHPLTIADGLLRWLGRG